MPQRIERGLEQVGQTITYPRDRYLIHFLEELPYEDALNVVERACPDATLGFGLNATQVRAAGESWQFLNKLAVCVQVTVEGDRIAVYHCDSIFYRIRAVPLTP